MTVEWHGKEATVYVKNKVVKRLEIAGRIYRDFIRTKISIPNVTAAALAKAMAGKRISKSARGGNPSVAGDYPKKLTGHLRRNIQMEIDTVKMIARVGTNVLYAKFLEMGTRKMKSRPFMQKALKECFSRLKKVLESETI